MIGALRLAKGLKDSIPDIKICFVGSHTSALPIEVLTEDCVDIVLLNEGVYALHNLLKSNLNSDLPNIKGIGFKKNDLLEGEIPILKSSSVSCASRINGCRFTRLCMGFIAL